MTQLSLESKIEIAKVVVKDALGQFRRPAIVWSAGKDSTTVLHICKNVCSELGEQIPPCIFINHGDHFPQTLEMVETVSKDWQFKVLFAQNEDVLRNVDENSMVSVDSLSPMNREEIKKIGFSGSSFECSLDSVVGNHLLKTVPMNNIISKYKLDALLTGIRWDENPARASEHFISERENPFHSRIQPILPFTERDIWNYKFKYDIPSHPLYEKGFRSIDGKKDSIKISDIPAWEQDLEHTNERAGRSQGKEEIMAKLRELGYM